MISYLWIIHSAENSETPELNQLHKEKQRTESSEWCGVTFPFLHTKKKHGAKYMSLDNFAMQIFISKIMPDLKIKYEN